MWKPSKNTKIEELTKSHRERHINLSALDPVIIDDQKHCVWCTKKLIGRQLKWCSQECTDMACTWANPQKEGSLHVLLVKQDFKCAHCNFDYMPFVQDSIVRMNSIHKSVDPEKIREKIYERLMKILKFRVPSAQMLEVDHITPIYKGGLPLDINNLQVLCFTCHKAKTKIDLSGKRKKKEK